jgi:hypothetical protein
VIDPKKYVRLTLDHANKPDRPRTRKKRSVKRRESIEPHDRNIGA